jgi:hypothetical protein
VRMRKHYAGEGSGKPSFLIRASNWKASMQDGAEVGRYQRLQMGCMVPECVLLYSLVVVARSSSLNILNNLKEREGSASISHICIRSTYSTIVLAG